MAKAKKTTNTKDAKFAAINENKIEKAIRNSSALEAAFDRAKAFDFDVDIDSACNKPYLKVAERFTIRKIFDLKTGDFVYKLYKEVFYINDPAKHYYETVDEDKVYRRIAAQKEHGDLKWAKALKKNMGVEIVDDGDTTDPTPDTTDTSAGSDL